MTKRKYTKAELVLQEYHPGVGEEGWFDVPWDMSLTDSAPDNAAAVKKYIRAAGLTGTYRIVAVKGQFTTTAKTTIEFE